MERFTRVMGAFLKIVAALCGIALFFGIAYGLYWTCGHVMEAIVLYWNVAKNNIAETVIFYLLFSVAIFTIEKIVKGIQKRKKEKVKK